MQAVTHFLSNSLRRPVLLLVALHSAAVRHWLVPTSRYRPAAQLLEHIFVEGVISKPAVVHSAGKRHEELVVRVREVGSAAQLEMHWRAEMKENVPPKQAVSHLRATLSVHKRGSQTATQVLAGGSVSSVYMARLGNVRPWHWARVAQSRPMVRWLAT